MTKKQAKAIEHLLAHPDASPEEICEAAGVSSWGDNYARFIWRLLNSGLIHLATKEENLMTELQSWEVVLSDGGTATVTIPVPCAKNENDAYCRARAIIARNRGGDGFIHLVEARPMGTGGYYPLTEYATAKQIHEDRLSPTRTLKVICNTEPAITLSPGHKVILKGREVRDLVLSWNGKELRVETGPLTIYDERT